MKAKITNMKVGEGRYIAVVFDVLNDKDEVLGSSSCESPHDSIIEAVQKVIAEFEAAHAVFNVFETGDIIEADGTIVKLK
jgi:hypothetical protein